MAVRSRAGTTAARLNAEQVVEDRHDEVVVQVLAGGAPHDERHDRQPVGAEVAQQFDRGVVTPRRDGALNHVGLEPFDDVTTDRALELEHQPRTDRLDDRRCARLFAVLDVVDVLVLIGVDESHGAAADDARHRVGEQLATRHEHPGGPRAADELVGRQEDGVLVGLRAVRWGGDPQAHIRPGGGEVPERQATVLVQDL